MFPTKARSPTVFDSKSAKVGGGAACYLRATEVPPPPVYVHALGHVTYEGHHPERTLLYQLIEQYYPALVEPLDAQGRSLPTHVHQAFEAYLKCGRQDQRRLTPGRFQGDRSAVRDLFRPGDSYP